MRKRTLKAMCKEIFWHILYFIPIVIGLLSCLVFSTDTFATYLTTDDPNPYEVTDLTGTVWLFDEDIDLNGYLASEDSVDYDVLFLVDGKEYTNIRIRLYEYSTTELVSTLDFDGMEVYDSLRSGWNAEEYRVVRFLSWKNTDNVELIGFMRSYARLLATPDTPNTAEKVYKYINDSFNSSFDLLGFEFENDIIYTSLMDLFGLEGIVPILVEDTFLIKWLVYYFYVIIFHIFVDFLLWIPRLCHELIERTTRSD
ncbi:MAG: hypothetical protein J6D30_04765 [Clostridia bacterium]|nr:hypothetical protein [Clostridia bacterium]